MSDCGRGLGDICGRVATRRAKATSLQVDQSTDVTHTSQQVRRRVRPVVGPDQLPVEVVVLTLPVVAEAGLGVLVKSAASCSEKQKERKKGHEKEKRQRKRTTGIPEETFGKDRLSSFEINLEATRANITFVILPIKYLLKNVSLTPAGSGDFTSPSETSPLLPWPLMKEVPQVVPLLRNPSLPHSKAYIHSALIAATARPPFRLRRPSRQLTEAFCCAFVFIKKKSLFFVLRKKRVTKGRRVTKRRGVKESHNRYR